MHLVYMKLYQYSTQFTARVKVVNKRAVDPRTGQPLRTLTSNILGLAFTCQSCYSCFILKPLIRKETKDAHNEFSDFSDGAECRLSST
jgi:hypothetical protein